MESLETTRSCFGSVGGAVSAFPPVARSWRAVLTAVAPLTFAIPVCFAAFVREPAATPPLP